MQVLNLGIPHSTLSLRTPCQIGHSTLATLLAMCVQSEGGSAIARSGCTLDLAAAHSPWWLPCKHSTLRFPIQPCDCGLPIEIGHRTFARLQRFSVQWQRGVCNGKGGCA